MLWGMSTSAETKPHVMLTNSGRNSEEKRLHNISLDCFFGAIVGGILGDTATKSSSLVDRKLL